jgi:predicted PurR-regulated permease PerM
MAKPDGGQGSYGDRERSGSGEPRPPRRRSRRRRSGSQRGDTERGDTQRGDTERGDTQRGDTQRGDTPRRGQRGRGAKKPGATTSSDQIFKIATPRDRFLGSTILIIALVLLVGAGVLIFWPFWSPLFLAATFTMICYPVYHRILRMVGEKRRTLSSILTCTLFILILLVPAAWAGWKLVSQASERVKNVGDRVVEIVDDARERHPALGAYIDQYSVKDVAKKLSEAFHQLAFVLGSEQRVRPEISDSEPQALEPPGDESDLEPVQVVPAREQGEEATVSSDAAVDGSSKGLWAAFAVFQRVTGFVGGLLADVFGVAVRFLLMVFLMFYFFRDGEQIAASLRKAIPVASDYQAKVIDTYRQVVGSLLRGTLVTASLQGIVAGIAFQIVGISGFFWGAVAAACALVPLAGTGLVTIPVILHFLIDDEYGAAIFIAVVAVVIASMDNFVRPYLLKGDLNMHPVWILLSFLGGVSAFGLVGIIVGPMIVVLIGTVLTLVREDSAPGAGTTDGQAAPAS